MKKYTLNLVFLALALALIIAAQNNWLDKYAINVLIAMGLNIIFAVSLNLVNGYMGEFTCGHAGFMCVGAYTASIISLLCFSTKFTAAPLLPAWLSPMAFPLIMAASALAAALAGFLVALPSFKIRDDYLAIITIAANFIIISLIENLDVIGGPRGISGMSRTVKAMTATLNIPWMMIWVILGAYFSIMVIYRLVNSTYGKGIPAVRQNEVAAEIMSVDTNKMKTVAFMIAAGLAGLAGSLFAHTYGTVNASSFGLLRSTEGLVMVYLGGMGSLSGAVMAAVAFTLLVEALRLGLPGLNVFLHQIHLLPASFDLSQIWNWVIIPLILILLMRYRPEGLMGHRELTHVFPSLRRLITLK